MMHDAWALLPLVVVVVVGVVAVMTVVEVVMTSWISRRCRRRPQKWCACA